ncbi:hypothetical protein BD289DRAFT_426555 [Coniella lustricola]|uniref:Uncharacterized protein n=1 Tax=Coniella lustricola TaxID=2025994 RepID=A0A2T3AG66_9PEZI|nr:hypothetical protein BD289DRAFT_426555 [Coniella lustricola]
MACWDWRRKRLCDMLPRILAALRIRSRKQATSFFPYTKDKEHASSSWPAIARGIGWLTGRRHTADKDTPGSLMTLEPGHYFCTIISPSDNLLCWPKLFRGLETLSHGWTGLLGCLASRLENKTAVNSSKSNNLRREFYQQVLCTMSTRSGPLACSLYHEIIDKKSQPESSPPTCCTI